MAICLFVHMKLYTMEMMEDDSIYVFMVSLNGFSDKAPQTDGMLLKRDFGAQ